MSEERVYERRRFSARDSATPLATALAWAGGPGTCQGGTALTFIVLAHVVGEHAREYEALTVDELRRWARTHADTRHVDEVIWTPTKLYVDIDMEYAPNATHAVATIDRFVTALVAALDERLGIEASSVVHLDASRVGLKFSRHIIIDMARSGAPVRFASSEHAGAFVRDVSVRGGFEDVNVRSDGTEPTPLADYGLYSANHCLRLYGSTKLGDDTRPLLEYGAPPPTTHKNVLSWKLLERSLVTWPRVTAEDALVRIDGVRLTMKRPRSVSVVADDADNEPLCRSVAAALRRTDVTGVREGDDGLLLVACASRTCTYARRTHRVNPIFALINVRRGEYAYGCHSPKCKLVQQRKLWVPLDAAALADVRAHANSWRRPLAQSAPARLEYGSALERLFHKPIS